MFKQLTQFLLIRQITMTTAVIEATQDDVHKKNIEVITITTILRFESESGDMCGNFYTGGVLVMGGCPSHKMGFMFG